MGICSSGSRLVFLVHVLLVQRWRPQVQLGLWFLWLKYLPKLFSKILVSDFSKIYLPILLQFFSKHSSQIYYVLLLSCPSLFFPLPPLICMYLSFSLASTGTLSKHETIVFYGKATPLFWSFNGSCQLNALILSFPQSSWTYWEVLIGAEAIFLIWPSHGLILMDFVFQGFLKFSLEFGV